MKTISVSTRYYIGDKVFYYDRDLNLWMETTIRRITMDISRDGFKLCYYDEGNEPHHEKELFRKPIESIRK